MGLKISLCLLLGACGRGTPAGPKPPVADTAKPVDAPADAAIDAMGPDLSCLGQPAPGGGSGPIAITGKVFAVDHYAVAPTTATVELRRRSDDGLVGQAISAAADGAFSIAAPGPVDGYFVVTAN